MQRMVIVGAGHAGGTLAGLLRHQGYEGSIQLIGDEPYLPYQRPPLSKRCLSGPWVPTDLFLRPAAFYADHHIDVLTGSTVAAIHRSERTVLLTTGSTIPYDHLVLATGSRTRNLPVAGSESADILQLRTIADASRLDQSLQPGARLVIAGAGYVGLEVAAGAIRRGMAVTIVERESRMLSRVASEVISDFFRRYHEERGVTLLTGETVCSIDTTAGSKQVLLSSGASITCDVVVAGIGALANDELARAAGLDCDNGVLVDEFSATSDPAISAIGDVSRRVVTDYGGMHRLESVANAIEQAKRVACKLTQRAPPPAEVPWFWSDQNDIKLQIAGLLDQIDQVIVRGSPASGRFAVLHLRDGALRAVEAVNRPGDFMAGKMLIAAGRRIPAEILSNPDIPLLQRVA